MIDYDCIGFCALCHKSLIEEKVITGSNGKPEIQTVFTSDRTEIEVCLDNGSLMRVAMCKKCKSNYTVKDNKPLMESIVNGWEKEVEHLPHWTKDNKADYMKKYSKLKIKERTK